MYRPRNIGWSRFRGYTFSWSRENRFSSLLAYYLPFLYIMAKYLETIILDLRLPFVCNRSRSCIRRIQFLMKPFIVSHHKRVKECKHSTTTMIIFKLFTKFYIIIICLFHTLKRCLCTKKNIFGQDICNTHEYKCTHTRT